MPGFDLDPTAMLLGVLFGGVGFVAFRYGRRMQQTPPLVLGMTLMIYPLFVASALWTAVIGTGLICGLWLWRE
jgi:hypothetical protein